MLKNLIFDVGDVLLEYRWQDMLVEHGLSREEALRIGSEVFANPYWSLLDYGTVLPDEAIRGYSQIYPEDAEIIAWFVTHGELMYVNRPDVWEKVHELKEIGYSIYLLSNYSEDLFRKHTREAAFLQDIDGGIISWREHMMKPDPRIYQLLLDRYQLKAEECIFYDDREENTAAARRLGIAAETITSRQQLLGLLEKRSQSHDRTCGKRAGI